MADALTKYGTPELQTAIKEYRAEILTDSEQCDNLHELVESMLEKQPA
jgi:hypothetical protein